MDYRLLSNTNNNYPTHHHWFPKMCSCLESGTLGSVNFPSGQSSSYKRLGSPPTLFDLSELMQRTRRAELSKDETIDDERQAEITFHNSDRTWNTIVVEKNLRTMDLCELLKVKNRVSGMDWSIVETWTELGIERTLEDHEDILGVYKEMELFASHHERRFCFQRDFIKYELFINPKQFFPPDMVALPHFDERNSMSSFESKLKDHLMQNNMECPQVFSVVWLRGENSQIWKKTHMMLEDRKLYIVRKAHNTPLRRAMDNEQLIPFAHLSDYHVYKIPNAKKYFNAPFEWGACLRPSSNAEAEETEAGVPGLKVIAFNSEKSRTCWLTAMRFAKYGKQLRENYRAFKNKQCEQNDASSPKEQYRTYNVASDSFRSRVAMDFTGSVGRIVDDPKEARDIAESEGLIWRRRWRPFSRSPPGCAVIRKHALDDGVHVLKPWFHRDVNRDTAASLVREHGTVDGVFLVRESKSYPGAFVLTYKYGDKVIHAQIQPTVDERGNGCLYTLDKGVTKFYDLIQLVDFYQLNAGSLPTRLTHYVSNGQSPSPIEGESSSPSPSPSSTKQSHSPRKINSKTSRS